MTNREQTESKISKILTDIVDVYKEYNPGGKYLSLTFIDGVMFFSNESWKKDAGLPISTLNIPYKAGSGVLHQLKKRISEVITSYGENVYEDVTFADSVYNNGYLAALGSVLGWIEEISNDAK